MFVIGLALAAPAVVSAKPRVTAQAESQVVELSREVMAIRSVRGEGNRTIDVARALKVALLASGWQDKDVEITPFEDTAYFIATWPGSDPKLKPLVLSGHMDVVEAKAADWERDPFVPVVENGYLYGRGASDMKFSGVLAMVALMELRKQGYQPKRTIVFEFSGDEETTMRTSKVIAGRLANAEMVLNTDGSGGVYDAAGKPLYWTWDGAEKTYVDYRLEVTNPGGHSSAPRGENAIVQLATALERIGAYRFKPELSPLTKAYFERAAQFESEPALAAAMRAFAANPADAAALATLRASASYVGKTGTTCVVTMVGGGHAENALPQRATANINCRIFPGHKREEIMAELARVANVPEVKFTEMTGGESVETDASPMRTDFTAAVERAMKASWPGVPIVPTQASGASDSMWFRALGIPAYGISPIFIRDADDFAHGLNERVQLNNIRPGLTYYYSLLTDLSD